MRYNSSLYNRWSWKQWWTLTLLPMIEFSHTVRNKSWHLEIRWLWYEYRLNIFGPLDVKPTAVQEPVDNSEIWDDEGPEEGYRSAVTHTAPYSEEEMIAAQTQIARLTRERDALADWQDDMLESLKATVDVDNKLRDLVGTKYLGKTLSVAAVEEITRLRNIIDQVDSVLTDNWIEVKKDDYRDALHKLLSYNMAMYVDPVISVEAAYLQKLIDTLSIQLDLNPPARNWASVKQALHNYRYEREAAYPAGIAPYTRSKRQHRITQWAVEAFGTDEATHLAQRGLRLFEEAAEAFQATGGSPDKAHQLVERVWERPVGDLAQELGGVGVTLLVLASAAKLDADVCEHDEVMRVLSKPLAHFKARNQAKKDAGLSMMPDKNTQSTGLSQAVRYQSDIEDSYPEAQRHGQVRATSAGHPDPNRRWARLECICGASFEAKGLESLQNATAALEAHVASFIPSQQ